MTTTASKSERHPKSGGYMDKETPKPLHRGDGGTVDPSEIEKFAAIADEWWSADGKFKPLHKFNPVRIGYIRDKICERFERDGMAPTPLQGLRILDIGCGGGLLCEPLCRLGASVTGVDATERSVMAARAHAEQMGLEIDYQFTTVEALAESGETFDVVLNMEVVEHVADVDLFLEKSGSLVNEGGLFFLATLNRTAKSFALAIVGAEYILRWLPRGTHDWQKFVKPSEAAAALRRARLEPQELTGVAYNPITDSWRLALRDLNVNYMGVFARS